MLEMPDDPIPQLQSESCEDWIEQDVERENLTALDMIADLPANRAVRMKQSDAFPDDLALFADIAVQLRSPLIRLADIIGRRGQQ